MINFSEIKARVDIRDVCDGGCLMRDKLTAAQIETLTFASGGVPAGGGLDCAIIFLFRKAEQKG